MCITQNQFVDIIDIVSSTIYKEYSTNGNAEYIYSFTLYLNGFNSLHHYCGPIPQKVMNKIFSNLRDEYASIDFSISRGTKK